MQRSRSVILSKQASRDYIQARGTAHKKLLQNSKKQLENEITQLDEQIKKLKTELSQLNYQRDKALERTISAQLVYGHLMDVPGISHRRYQTIVKSIFNGELSSLRMCYSIKGIGSQTQREIDKWIDYYQSKMLSLISQDFPNKASIIAKYKEDASNLRKQVAKLTKEKSRFEQLLKSVLDELPWLESVTIDNFTNSFLGDDSANVKIDHYLKGVFSEWEEMPDWFQKAISVGGQRTVTSAPTPSLSAENYQISATIFEKSAIINVLKSIPLAARWLFLLIIPCCCISMFTFMVFSASLAASETPTSTPTTMPTSTATFRPTSTLTSTSIKIPTNTPSPAITATPSPSPSPRPSITPTSTPVLRFVVTPANMRAGPGIEYVIITILRPEDPVIIQEVNEQETWYRVHLVDGVEGWVSASMLAPVEE